MKSTLYLNAFLLTMILIVSVSCNKNKMPDEDKDWNILEWKVDGKKYKADCESGPLFGCDPVDCQYYHDDKTLSIIGGHEGSGIQIYKYRSLNTNNNVIRLDSSDIMKYVHSPNERGCKDYNLDTSYSYNLRIEPIDTINKIISGTFSFRATNNCQDTVLLSDGYFKLSYRP